MENKRQFKPFAIIHNDIIKSLRSYIELSKLYYEINKNLLDNNEYKEQWISYLQDECRELKAEINNTIEHYQCNKSFITEIEKAKEKCKDCNILLNKYKLELINLGAEIQNKELENAFDFDLSNDNLIKKELLPNYLEIQKEFLDYIKIEETQDSKKIKNIEDEYWFIIGTKYATGEIQKLLKENNDSFTKVARLLGNENFRPFISSSYATDKVTPQNIYSRKEKDIIAINEFCLKNNKPIVCERFKALINKIQT